MGAISKLADRLLEKGLIAREVRHTVRRTAITVKQVA